MATSSVVQSLCARGTQWRGAATARCALIYIFFHLRPALCHDTSLVQQERVTGSRVEKKEDFACGAPSCGTQDWWEYGERVKEGTKMEEKRNYFNSAGLEKQESQSLLWKGERCSQLHIRTNTSCPVAQRHVIDVCACTLCLAAPFLAVRRARCERALVLPHPLFLLKLNQFFRRC